MSGIKSRDFTSRCEGALDEIASVGGDISAGRAAGKAEALCKMVCGGLHSQGIICWWALVMAFKDF